VISENVASNKNIIVKLEAKLQKACDGIHRIECKKMQSMENSLNDIKNLLFEINLFFDKSTNNIMKNDQHLMAHLQVTSSSRQHLN
jgi:hypothetical protein